MSTWFHVSSVSNRASIERHGLDPRRMGSVAGVAGSPVPEVDGVFLCRDVDEVEFFVRMAAERTATDVWEIGDVDESLLTWSEEEFVVHPAPIPGTRVRRVRPPGG